MSGEDRPVERRWRYFETSTGRKPVLEFMRALARDHPSDAAQIAEEMEHVRDAGTREARKLTRDLYEVRAEGDRVTYRVLFSVEGEKGRILLAIEAFSKKSQKTPASALEVAEGRLAGWRRRGLPGYRT